MIKLMRFLFFLVVGGLTAIQGMAVVGWAFDGEWRSTEIVEDDAGSVGCRALHVVTRRYQLEKSQGGPLGGKYVREYSHLLFGAINDCAGDMSPTQSLNRSRLDWWHVGGGRRVQNAVTLVGRYGGCVGACNSGAPVQRVFEAKLRHDNGVLIDEEDGQQRLVFVPEATAVSAETEAGRRAFSLLEPLYRGNCTRFYEENLDPRAQNNSPKTEFCDVVRRLGKLMPRILYHKPLTSIYFSFAELKMPPLRSPVRIWGAVDVLVEQFFVVEPDGSGVPVGAVLRKQTDKSWKVLVPVP